MTGVYPYRPRPPKAANEIDPDGKEPGELHKDNLARYTHKHDDEKQVA